MIGFTLQNMISFWAAKRNLSVVLLPTKRAAIQSLKLTVLFLTLNDKYNSNKIGAEGFQSCPLF